MQQVKKIPIRLGKAGKCRRIFDAVLDEKGRIASLEIRIEHKVFTVAIETIYKQISAA